MAGGSSLVGPSQAYGAGSGYTPPGTPTTGGSATGLAGTVVTSTTIQPSGGTANAVVGSATITASVPAGAFTGAVQVVMTDAAGSDVLPSPGVSPVVTFGIGIYVNGSKVTGTFPAVGVTITSPAITAGSTVYLLTGSGLQTATGAAVQAGSASFSITSDPVVEVTAPVSTTSGAASGGAAGATSSGGTASGAAIAGATSGETGKPFLLEELAAGALVAFGALALVALRLRRRTA